MQQNPAKQKKTSHMFETNNPSSTPCEREAQLEPNHEQNPSVPPPSHHPGPPEPYPTHEPIPSSTTGNENLNVSLALKF